MGDVVQANFDRSGLRGALERLLLTAERAADERATADEIVAFWNEAAAARRLLGLTRAA